MKKITLLTLAAISLFASCKPEYDEPPIRTIPEGNVLTIQEMKNLFYANGAGFTFEEEYSVYGVVTTDETSGNFYKEVYVQDSTGAIQLRLLNSGGLYRGDSVRLYLKGTYISEYRGMMQLDSVDADNNVIKQSTGATITPKVYNSVADLAYTSLSTSDIGKWIQINNVNFSKSDFGSTWSDAVGQTDVNHTLIDCDGNSVIVRTSGYANFADDTIPELNGTFYAILGVYNTDVQLYIQDPSDLELTNPWCGPYLSQDFESGSFGDWTTQLVTGTIDWSMGTFGGNSLAQMSNYSGGNQESETWLISPNVDLTGATSPGFSFESAYSYTGPAMEVFVTDNYTGDVTTTSWQSIPYTLPATSDFTFYTSGLINFTGFAGSNIRVAFKYTGTSTTGSTWEVDNIQITEI